MCGRRGVEVRPNFNWEKSWQRFPLQPIMLFGAHEIRRKEPLH